MTEIESAREVLSLAGERWTVPVLSQLRGSTKRFTELLRALPDLQRRQLTRTLKLLERDGYITRKAYPTIPPRVEYRLTELGKNLLESLAVVGRFATKYRKDIETARLHFDGWRNGTDFAGGFGCMQVPENLPQRNAP